MIYSKQLRDYILDAAEELTGIKYLKSDGKLMLDAVCLGIQKALADGETINISEFGKFYVHNYPEKRTECIDGKVRIVPAHKGVKFTPSMALKRSTAQGIVRPQEMVVR